ncbi:hypothetical protein K493DRAFT_298708 [Basidiobolus meristosporus CBS 931.73]|uniref:CNH-domain-containing protein n=1 Tax=Basidiobolus meristosporus CBS 931.73 TaxID=1314790 RepID=A0A1Y1YSH6_9FUNG|nr:hypothetical protein K493DRAFT_298708 [Basidiobolus meristosporus CBS 931.73]|eukprot:ORY00784.1 hypothetical protein K493DRAFT_298708 [Basidiobolus meristosporus CBS 931.73]
MGSSSPPPNSPYTHLSLNRENIKRPPSPLFPYPLSPTDSSQESQNTPAISVFTRNVSGSPRTIYDSPPLPPRPSCPKILSSPNLSILPTNGSNRTLKRSSTPVLNSLNIDNRKQLPAPQQKPFFSQCNNDEPTLIVCKPLKPENSAFYEYRKAPNHNKPLPQIPRKSSCPLPPSITTDSLLVSGLEQRISSPKRPSIQFRHKSSTNIDTEISASPESRIFKRIHTIQEAIAESGSDNPQIELGASPTATPRRDMNTHRQGSLLLQSCLNVQTEAQTLRKSSVPELSQQFHEDSHKDIKDTSDDDEKPLAEIIDLRHSVDLRPTLSKIKETLESAKSSPVHPIVLAPIESAKEPDVKESDSDTNSAGCTRQSRNLDEASVMSDLSSDEFSLSTSFCDKELKEMDGVSSLHADSAVFQLEEFQNEQNEVSTISEESILSDDLDVDSKNTSHNSLVKDQDQSQEPSRRSIEVVGDKLRCWANTVPPEVTQNMSEKDIKRQEIIFETIYTEEEYLADLRLIEKVFVIPLKEKEIIEKERVDSFLQDLFANIKELEVVHNRIVEALVARQNQNLVVQEIGDIYLCEIKAMEAYLEYGSNLVVAQRVLDKELKKNQNLVKYLQEQERNPETRKLDLKSFMSRPTTRLGRYNLLFESIIKYTPETNPDKEILRKALDGIREILKRINEETGQRNSVIRIHDLMDQIVFKPGEFQDLQLNDPNRKLIREGQFKRPTGHSLRVFLFDHVFLLTKEKKHSNGSVFYRVYGRPIPLELFTFNEPDSVSPAVSDSVKLGFPFCFTHISKRGSTYTLLATSPAERKQWVNRIQDQRARRMMERPHAFDIITISDSTFGLVCRITCSTHYTAANKSRKIVIGADDGVYVGIEGNSTSFSKVLSLEKIRHIEILEEFEMILVLQDRLLICYSIDLLDNPKRFVNRHGQKLASHVTYFCAGTLNDHKYVAIMKLKGLKSFCKILEPVKVSQVKGKPKLLCQKNGYALKLTNQLCISTDFNSICFMKKRLYLVSSKGFEVLDLENEAHRAIPDPKNERQFSFFTKYEHYKPLAMYRIGSEELLLCYDEFVFYIDNDGHRSRPEFFMEWEGQPTTLALHYPYLIGFNPSFIEIRNVETGALEQVIETTGLRCLNNGKNKTGIYCVMEPFQSHHQYIFQLRMPTRLQPPTTSSTEGQAGLALSDVV